MKSKLYLVNGKFDWIGPRFDKNLQFILLDKKRHVYTEQSYRTTKTLGIAYNNPDWFSFSGALDFDDRLIEPQKIASSARNSKQLPYDNYQPLEVV